MNGEQPQVRLLEFAKHLLRPVRPRRISELRRPHKSVGLPIDEIQMRIVVLGCAGVRLSSELSGASGEQDELASSDEPWNLHHEIPMLIFMPIVKIVGILGTRLQPSDEEVFRREGDVGGVLGGRSALVNAAVESGESRDDGFVVWGRIGSERFVFRRLQNFGFGDVVDRQPRWRLSIGRLVPDY